jgi:hypothetical protein
VIRGKYPPSHTHSQVLNGNRSQEAGVLFPQVPSAYITTMHTHIRNTVAAAIFLYHIAV